MNTKLSGAFALIFFFFFLSACQSYKKVPYLQDAEILKQANTQVAPVQDARLIPGDEVSILVSTSDPVVSQPFNAQGSTFLLDDQGNINYPVLGKLPLNGLTSREAENLITDRLKSYVKERPTVVVRMSGFKISVLGEVASPGVYPVVNEQINVLEALAMAGDLTIYGVRDNVKLIREDRNGHKQFVTLNLNDADLLLSPYYQLQQNAYNQRLRKYFPQFAEQTEQRSPLCQCTRVFGTSRHIQPSFVTNTYRMGVMVTAVCPDLFQRTALVDFSIPGDVEMIADVTESPVKDMILTASLRRKGLSFRRGTAMNDNQSDGTHKATYSSVLRSDLR